MEKKESTTSSHVGICEQLFQAFNPASRPHRRLTHHHQGPRASPNPSPLKETGPQKALPSTPVKPKPSEAIAPKAEPKPTTTPPPPPPPTSVPIQKVPDKLELASAPPKAAKIPQPAPPKAAATPQPLPQPAPPQGAAAEAAATEKPKKNINERVEDYIKRTKERLRSVSGIGRTPTLKMKD